MVGKPLPAPSIGRGKYYGGLLGGDGCIYGVPQCADGVLKIDPATQEVTTFGAVPGGWKWHGGVVAEDGTIWGIPSNSDEVLRIDPFNEELSMLPFDYTYTCHHRADGKYKYLGAVLAGDGCIYCIPSDADRVLKIDPVSRRCVEIGESLSGRVSRDRSKWQNGFLGRDGCVYGIPLHADAVLRVDPMTDEVSTLSISSGASGAAADGLVGFEKWEGGVTTEDGTMFAMPLNSKHVLQIVAGDSSADDAIANAG